jgi:hypothetical protein
MILVPKYKDIILNPRAPTVRVAGYYTLEAIGLDGRKRFLGKFPNLITNGGLDMLGGYSNVFNTCAVGSGNTAPSNTDTALVTLVASTTNAISATYSTAGSSPYFGSTIVTWQFPTGAAAGNLSEVGIGTAATALYSRALILDGGGSPTTITILSTEALNVTYTMQQYVPLTDVTGSISLGGSSYGYTIRAANATNQTYWCQVFGLPTAPNLRSGFQAAYATGTLGAITSQPSGTTFADSGCTTAGYTNGSYTLQSTSNWDINHGNAPGGIGSILYTIGNQTAGGGSASFGRGQWQIAFSPVIPKDNTHVLQLLLNISWARFP